MKRLIEAGRSDLPDTERLRGLAGSMGYGAGAVSAGGSAAAVKGVAILGGGAAKIAVVAVLVLGAGAGVTALATRDVTWTRQTDLTATSAAGDTLPFSSQPRLDPEVATVAPSSREPTLPPTQETPFAASPSIARDMPSIAVPNAATAAEKTPRVAPTATASAAPFADPSVAPAGTGALASPDYLPRETEFSLLEQAQRALRSDPQRALDLADRDAKRFPSGALAQEREVIAIEALAKLGRADATRERANRFFQAFPGSAHEPRIASLLGFEAGVHNP
jgi:hypothetical protein